MIAARALALLRQALADPAAEFRDGQLDAILALVERRARLLVVQRTGWGKSAVYFLSTRLLRERGAGPTLLVSPLLALMRDQLLAAERLGVRAVTINSSNKDEWADIERRLHAGEADLLLISPERLANDDFVTRTLLPLAAKVGLFVVDEAHCVSDWGHDFRPDYRRIVRVLERLPKGVPVCATTATANSRVVADVSRQLGAGLEVSRGPLVRASIRLQTVKLPDDASKLAWLAQYLPTLRNQGCGIVYAHTQQWSERIAAWLRAHGMNAEPYHAGLENEVRQAREQALLANGLDALVATTALGMGFDKPDLGFVVHFHQPASVVHYYQQVGRAGRAIDLAYGVMLSGGDDRRINDWFIEEAFPPEDRLQQVMAALEGSQGLTARQLEQAVNLRRGALEKALKVLASEDPAPVAYSEGKWHATTARADAGRRRRLWEKLTRLRRDEQRQMDAYAAHAGCFMEFLAHALDDPHVGPCGQCAWCRGKPDAMRAVAPERTAAAVTFLRGTEIVIEPRAQWPDVMPGMGLKGKIAPALRAEEGRALCLTGDAGWGKLITDGELDARLAEAMAALVRRWGVAPEWVACVPSLRRPDRVPALARAVAGHLGLPFVVALRKNRESQPQSEMENSWQQARNLDGCFEASQARTRPGPVLLIDDLTDSGWTFTVAAALLRQAGAGPVFPLALSSGR